MAQQQTIDMLGPESRAAHALVGAGGTSWVWPGDALTASVVKQWFNLDLPAVAYVRVLVVWNPKGNTNNGVRVVHADDGPTNITALGEVTGLTYSGPRVDAVDVTTSWNDLITGATAKNIGLQLRGNPIVFRVTLEIVNS